MRLSPAQINLLKTTTQQLDKNARLFLFGSRTDDTKTGGDIDLLILSEQLSKQHLRTIKWQFYETFGEQKIDIIIDSGKLESPFVRLIFPTAIEL
ncbi:MAG: nucleotidyltransferase domain-containing protein [Methylococcaceae bacterium]